MVDAEDLKSFGYCNRAGSSPAKATIINDYLFLAVNYRGFAQKSLFFCP